MAFETHLDRLKIINIGIDKLQKAFENIQSKIDIWVQNDPNFAISNVIDTPLILNYITRWPLLLHIIGACACLGGSTIYHTF